MMILLGKKGNNYDIHHAEILPTVIQQTYIE